MHLYHQPPGKTSPTSLHIQGGRFEEFISWFRLSPRSFGCLTACSKSLGLFRGGSAGVYRSFVLIVRVPLNPHRHRIAKMPFQDTDTLQP